jgi:UDP-glucose 4-epimerase
VGIRPGEKIHEVLVSEEEAPRTYDRGDYLAILPILPELRPPEIEGRPFEGREYSSADDLVDAEAVRALLERHGMLPGAQPQPAR